MPSSRLARDATAFKLYIIETQYKVIFFATIFISRFLNHSLGLYITPKKEFVFSLLKKNLKDKIANFANSKEKFKLGFQAR